MSDYRDMRGTEIKVGTLIAMPFAKHSTGYVRVGRVTELIPPKTNSYGGVPRKIRAEWLIHKEWSPPLTSIVENFGHALVLPADFPVRNSHEARTD